MSDLKETGFEITQKRRNNKDFKRVKKKKKLYMSYERP